MTPDEQNLGGGAGGGTGMDDHGNNLQSAGSTYQIAGNQVVLLSRKPVPLSPKVKPGPSRIVLLAAGGLPTYADDGNVDIRGAKGVRITSGPPAIPMMSPDTASEATNGVEIIVGETQKVTLQRGLTPLAQKIEMTSEGITLQCGSTPASPSIEMTADSITLQCGSTPVSPQIKMSPDGIVLSAGGAMQAITIGVDGTVVIEGLVIRITGDTLVAINS
jgi:hypothetical protein